VCRLELCRVLPRSSSKDKWSIVSVDTPHVRRVAEVCSNMSRHEPKSEQGFFCIMWHGRRRLRHKPIVPTKLAELGEGVSSDYGRV